MLLLDVKLKVDLPSSRRLDSELLNIPVSVANVDAITTNNCSRGCPTVCNKNFINLIELRIKEWVFIPPLQSRVGQE